MAASLLLLAVSASSSGRELLQASSTIGVSLCEHCVSCEQEEASVLPARKAQVTRICLCKC